MEVFRANFQTEEKQNCPICLGDFKLPIQLTCMHSFCEKCLQDFICSHERKLKELTQIECPICRQDVRILKQGKPVQMMPFLFPVNENLQSVVSETKEEVNYPCDSCHSTGTSRPSQGFCVHCKEAMCVHCLDVHQKLKISRNHAIINMREFTSNPHVMHFVKGFSCPEHHDESSDFYCKDHRKACCGKCCIISHRNCSHVSDLKKELPSLQEEKNPDNIINHMKILETHLKEFMEVNVSNMNLLESQINNLTAQIRELRRKLNDALDNLERSVKMEGNRIYKEEMIIKEEKIHRSQSLINSIRNSYTLLETVKKYGTEMQVFLTADMMTTQLTSYLDQIQQNCSKMDTTTVLLEVNPQVQPILSVNLDSLAKIISRKELRNLPVQGIRKPSRDCLVQRDRIIEIKGNDNLLENFTGLTYLYLGHVMLADFDHSKVCLLNSSYNSVISYKLQSAPYDVCTMDDDEVAVTLPGLKTIQFLSVKNGNITPTRMVTTRYYCYSVASTGNGNIIISGHCNDGGKHCWSHVSSGGKEEFYHQFDCPCSSSWTSVALDSSFTHVYISVNLAHSLYCFDTSGNQKFVYSHDSLKNPRGVGTDRYDNVYVIGSGCSKIHQLTPDGAVIQIISDGVPAIPKAICFSRDSDVFLVTNQSNSRKLYQFQLK